MRSFVLVFAMAWVCEGEAQAQTAETEDALGKKTIDATDEAVCVTVCVIACVSVFVCEAVCEWQAAVCETEASPQRRTETETCVSVPARVSVCEVVCEWANQEIAMRVCEQEEWGADAAGVCEC